MNSGLPRTYIVYYYVEKAYFFVFTEGSRRCEDLERSVYVFKLNVYIDHPDKASGRRWIRIQRNWIAKGPFVLTEHKSTSQWSYMVHRIKVDELAGCIMTTFDKRGLLVTDLNRKFHPMVPTTNI